MNRIFSNATLTLSACLIFVVSCTPDKTKKKANPSEAKQTPGETTTARTPNNIQGQDFLDRFKSNAKATIDQPLAKFDAETKSQLTDLRKYPKGRADFHKLYESIAPQLFEGRKSDDESVAVDRQGNSIYDDAKDLFRRGFRLEKRLSQLKTKANLSVTPWSSDYWAIAKGITSFRYADPNLDSKIQSDMARWGKVKADTATKFYSQIPKNSSEESQAGEFQSMAKVCKDEPLDRSRLLQCMDSQEKMKILNLYSPAEKYDILVGDLNFSLTRAQKAQTHRYKDSEGFVQMWMGICHGWAPAAYKVAAPQQPVVVLAADGETQIQFFADDIKALSVLKWANTRYSSHFVGGRCNVNETDIKKDATSGKILNEKCLDNGPNTWHLVIANKIGIQDESFVMDATFDYEVWNQPVIGYKVNYFNVKHMRLTTNLNEAKISIPELGKQDRFFGQRKLASNRNGIPTHIVGVQMDVTYIGETNPSHSGTLPPHKITVQYTYDLELDAQGKIVGGEWYNNTHPDFLWTPKAGSEPLNSIDRVIRSEGLSFNGLNGQKFASALKKSLGTSLGKLSRDSINNQDGSPLAEVIDGLVARSKFN